MPQISIIVPVYNAEKFLPQCIESLLAQTFQDIEIILVNDGSTDSSLDICEKYAKIDTRITIISKDNEGVAKARRDGIMKASAEYITFIDSDDYYEPEFCKKMFFCIRESDADLVECDYYSVSESSKRKHRIYSSDMELDVEKFHEIVVKKTIVNGSEAVVLWNKLFRKGLIIETVKEFGDDQLEDYVFNVQYYTMVERYVYIHQCLTNYRQVPMSLSRKCNLQAYEILKRAEIIKEGCLEKMGLVTDADKKEDAVWFVNYTMNFLNQYLLVNIPHSNEYMKNILQSEMFNEKCSLISQSDTFAQLITEKKFEDALRKIKRDAIMKKIRINLSRIKQFLLHKRGVKNES